MKIPFSIDEFLLTFERYNQVIWPMQIALYLIALIAIVFAFSNSKNASRGVLLILSFFWLWMGVVYHIVFFSTINQAAYFFGVVFVIQALAFLLAGIKKNSIDFEFRTGPLGIMALAFLAYALIIYPTIGLFTGHLYPRTPTFGVPCPTTIFTFGLLLFIRGKIPWYLMAIPIGWSLVGFSAAMQLSIVEDVGLVVAGLISGVVTLMSNKDEHKAQSPAGI